MRFKAPKIISHAKVRRERAAAVVSVILSGIQAIPSAEEFDKFLATFESSEMRRGIVEHYGRLVSFTPRAYWPGVKAALLRLECDHQYQLVTFERLPDQAIPWFRCSDCADWKPNA